MHLCTPASVGDGRKKSLSSVWTGCVFGVPLCKQFDVSDSCTAPPIVVRCTMELVKGASTIGRKATSSQDGLGQVLY